jgi:hypothetical protein
MDEALEALDAVVRQGKPRYIGVSNWPAYRAARGFRRSEVKNLTRIDCVQPRYCCFVRSNAFCCRCATKRALRTTSLPAGCLAASMTEPLRHWKALDLRCATPVPDIKIAIGTSSNSQRLKAFAVWLWRRGHARGGMGVVAPRRDRT